MVPETLHISQFISISRYRWTSLIRVTAFVIRFTNNLKIKDWKCRKLNPLSAAELLEAEFIWIWLVKKQFLNLELNYLRKNKGVRPALVSQLDLFLQDDVIRCQGRLSKAMLNAGCEASNFDTQEIGRHYSHHSVSSRLNAA